MDNTFTGNVTVALIDLTNTGATLGGTLNTMATDGVAVFSGLTVNMSGFYLLSAAANGVGGATTEPVNVIGPAGLSQSTITVSPAEIALGGKTTVTLTARDANGNREPGGGLTVAFTASGSAGTLSSTVTDNHNGTYTATFTGTSPGSDTITATIGGDSNKVISTATVTVVGPYSLSQSTIAVSPSTVASGGTTTVTLTARDVNGNQELGGGLKVTFALEGGTAGGKFGPIKDNKNGTYTATFTGTIAGTSTITAKIKGQAVTSALPTVTVVPGAVSLSKSTIAVSPSKVASGGTITVTLTARDADGNVEQGGLLLVDFGLGRGTARGNFGPVTNDGEGTYSVTWTGTTAGKNTITATIGGKAVTSAPPTITVVPGAVSLSQSTITVTPSKIALNGKTTVTLVARDANGNQEPSGGLTVNFALGSGSVGGTLSSAVTDHKNGTYTATFTGTIAGSDTITATIGGENNQVASKATVIVVGPYSLSKSTITVSPSTVASGGRTTVTLTVRDGNGNQELGGGLKVAFGLEGGTAGGKFGPVKNNKNGTYTATFTGTIAGASPIAATIGGQAVTSTPPTITVTPSGSAPPLSAMVLAAAAGGNGTPSSLTGDADSYGIHDAALLAFMRE